MKATAICAAITLLPLVAAACSTDHNCSLNGVCTAGACVCDKPWSGDACGALKYKTTPASAKNAYNTSDPRNTWNGPIFRGTDGKYHLYNPLYNKGSLGGPPTIMHGVADVITGPWDWKSQKDVCQKCGENPAFVAFKDGGTSVYSLWVGGKIWKADTPCESCTNLPTADFHIISDIISDGPFSEMKDITYPGGNPAPIWHNGAFYLTNQGTTEIYTCPSLKKDCWTKYADIPHIKIADQWHVEDPFLYVYPSIHPSSVPAPRQPLFTPN